MGARSAGSKLKHFSVHPQGHVGADCCGYLFRGRTWLRTWHRKHAQENNFLWSVAVLAWVLPVSVSTCRAYFHMLYNSFTVTYPKAIYPDLKGYIEKQRMICPVLREYSVWDLTSYKHACVVNRKASFTVVLTATERKTCFLPILGGLITPNFIAPKKLCWGIRREINTLRKWRS